MPFSDRWVPISARHSRLSWWERTYMLATLAFLAAVGLLWSMGDPHLWTVLGWGLAVFAVPSVIVAIAQKRKRAHTQQWLRSLDYRVCPECLYDLSGIESPGRCPECGLEFRSVELVETWRRIDEEWKKRQADGP
jgi:hypothetical protein